MALDPALAALFTNFQSGLGGLHMARIYTIQLAPVGAGLVLRFTDADFDISAVSATSALVNGFAYTSKGVAVDQKSSKTQAHWKLGTDTDTWTLVVMPRPFDLVTGAAFPDKIGTVPWLQAAQSGALDAADFQVDDAYFASVPTWPMPPGGAKPVGCKTIFAGTVAEVDTNNSAAVLTVNDYRQLFTLQMPLHFYQGQCRHTLFDGGCNASGNMNAASFAVNGTAAAGSTQAVIIGNGLAAPQGSGTYQLGRLLMTGGKNATFQRTIKSWDGAFTLGLLNPLPYPVAPDDTFQVFPGCDWTQATCAKFQPATAVDNFGGQPFIPPPETQGG